MVDYEKIKECLMRKDIIKALTLEERNKVIMKDLRPKITDAKSKYVKINSRAKADKVEERCNVEGLKEEDFYMAFYDCNDEAVNKKLYEYIEKQDWFKCFVEALAQFGSVDENVEDVFESKYTIYYACCFLMLYGRNELKKYVEELNNITVSRLVMNKMIEQMAGNLLQVYSKTVIYEYHMNKDKYIDKKNQNKLNQYIKDNFSNVDSIVDFYMKYPVLVRRLGKKVINMIDYYKEMLANINSEYCQMKEKKMICDSIMTDISCDIGDTHEAGKFVVKVYFGEDKIIYKPRNLYISETYNQFVSWINRRFDLHKLPTIKLIVRDNYTIEEYVKYESCLSEREIERYYKRIGYYIGILYLLNGNDIHYENIIAGGEYPYIIDLETLFAHNSEQLVYEHTAVEKIGRYISQSVKGSCLLPSYMFGNNKQKGVDVSGLSGRYAKIPGERPVLSDINSNNVRFEMRQTYLQDNNNIPKLNNERVSYEPYKQQIIEGFMEFVILVKDNKDEFISQIEKFKDVKVRQVIRATNNYGQILQYASHPSYTQDMIYLERMLESVWNYPFVNKSVCTSEMKELINDDIPIFYCNPGQREIVSGDGNVIHNFYERNSMDVITDKISALNEEEIYTQSLLIKESLGLGDIEKEEVLKKQTDILKYQEQSDNTLTIQLVDTVIENIYDILDTKAIYGKDDVSFFASVKDAYGNNSLSYMPIGFKNGMAGIVSYLLKCYEMYDDEKYFDMMKKIVNCIKNMQPVESKNSRIDGHYGIFSVLYPVHLYTDLTLDCDAIAMYDSIFAFCVTCIKEMKYKDADFVGIGYLLENCVRLYNRTRDFKYYKLIKELSCKLFEFGHYYILEKIDNKDICGLYYALLLVNQVIKDDAITNIQKMLVKEYVYDANYIDYKEALYRVKLYKNCGEEWLLDHIQKDIKAIHEVEVVDLEQLLYRIDFLYECMEAFSSDKEQLKSIYKEEMYKLIRLYRLDEAGIKYNSIINGLGLNSPVCGLGLRLLRYRRENEKDICIHGYEKRKCI